MGILLLKIKPHRKDEDMKKRMLFLTILLFSFFLCGCSVDYHIYVDRNKTVVEKGYYREQANVIEQNGSTKKEYLQLKKEAYQKLVMLKPYKLGTKETGNTAYGTSYRKYKNLKEYTDSYFYTSLYEKANIEEKDDILMFEATGENYLNDLFMVVDPSMKLDSIKIQVQFENEVVASNADQIDDLLNIHTWYFTADTEAKMIKFSLSKKIQYHIVIIHYLQENFFTIVLFASIVLVGFIIYRWFKNMEKKNNEI